MANRKSTFFSVGLLIVGTIYVFAPEAGCQSTSRFDAAEADINAHLMAGETLISAGRCEDASIEFQKVLDLDPSAPLKAKAYFGLGRCDETSKEYAQAVSDYTKYLRVFYMDRIGYLFRAYNFYYLHEYDKAVEDLTMCISLFHEQRSCPLILRGLCYTELTQYENAVDDFTAAIKCDPNSSDRWLWYLFRGKAYKKAGEDTSANDDFLKAYNLKTDYGNRK